MNKEKFFQLRNLTTQSFETFHVFGKPPEAVETIVKAFFAALDDVDLIDINHAFARWLKEKSVMPTPADIRKIALENRDHRVNFVKTGKGNGLTSFSGKRYHEMTDAMKSDLRDHLAQIPDDKREREIFYWTAFKYLPRSVADSWFPGWEKPKRVVVSHIPEDDGIEL